MKRIIVIGAGASGLVACATLKKENKYDIVLLEQSAKIATKVLASGNGRCNLSNTNMSILHYNTHHPIIEKVIEDFQPQYFEEMGMRLRYDGNLIYPYSLSSQTVKDLLLKQIKGIEIHQECCVKGIKKKGSGYQIETNQGCFQGDDVIVATGSKANKISGEHNLDFLQAMNLKIIPLKPSLVPICTKQIYKSLKGVRCLVHASLKRDGKIIKDIDGEVLFTDYGLSGICMMQLSRYIDDFHHYQVILNLLPEYSYDEGIKYLKDYQAKYGNDYSGIFHRKIADILLSQHLNPCALTFDIKGLLDYTRAQVMAGGLSLDEIDNSLQLIKYPHIYVCGEVLDVDGDCGGYNLHFAFGSGHYVAREIIEKDKAHVKNK